jgi:hypothetical protein
MTISPSWIGQEVWAKFDPLLQREIHAAHGDPTVELPVMMTVATDTPRTGTGPLAGKADREAIVAELRAAFTCEAGPIVDTLVEAGAQDVQIFWINRSIKARTSLSSLNTVASLPTVGHVVLDSLREVCGSDA